MRIIVYAPVFVRPTETFIYDVTTELVASGNIVSVIAESRESIAAHPFSPVNIVPSPVRMDPARILRRILRPFTGRPLGGEAAGLHRDRIRHHIQDFRPDVIFAHYGQSGVLLAPLAQEIRIPLMVSFHGVDASRLARDPIWKRRYRTMFESVAIATGPSEYVRNKLVDLGCPEDRAHILHNGVRTDLISFSPPKTRFDGTEIRFLFVGRLAEKKDPLTLLRSFKTARDTLLPLRSSLTIIGDGPMRNKVEDAVRTLELSESVKLRGRQTHDEVIRSFAEAHIYVQHSITAPSGDEEGLPVSITEALAAGLPVISTRHSGIPEVVHENVCGLLVQEKDSRGMADCMVRLARDLALCDRFGTAGRELLESEFATPVVQKRLRSLLLLAQESKLYS